MGNKKSNIEFITNGNITDVIIIGCRSTST